MDKRILVSDTDAGKKLSQRIEELCLLVKAYENGSFVELGLSLHIQKRFRVFIWKLWKLYDNVKTNTNIHRDIDEKHKKVYDISVYS